MKLFKPMLCDKISTQEGLRRLKNDQWWEQRKYDGDRLLVTIDEGNVIPVGRNGQPKDMPRELMNEFARFKTGEFVFDGELVNGVFVMFDLPVAGTQITLQSPWTRRIDILQQFYAGWNPGPCIILAPTACTEQEKTDLALECQKAGHEGVIFKRVDGIYRPGKRSAEVVKWKFWQSADVFIIEIGREGKSNAVMAKYVPTSKRTFQLPDGRKIPYEEVGTVSTLGKWARLVTQGCVIEAKYLYCVSRERPHLVQPNCLRVRTDKDAFECTMDDLHFTDKAIA